MDDRSARRSRPGSAAGDLDRLRRRVDELELAHDAAIAEVRALEQRCAELTSLYVTVYRVHASLDPVEVLVAIREIVANVVGSEEVAVFARERTGRMSVLDATGIDDAVLAQLARGEGALGEAIARREGLYAEDAGRAGGPPASACVPLVLDGEVVGAIAVLALLPHKPALQPIDRQVLELLGTHAAIALRASGAAKEGA
jgi:GAF domain-containing protein